jgi:hypothetical protein
VFFCVDGRFVLADVTDGGHGLWLRGGQGAYVSATHGPLRVRGAGTLLRVTTGRAGTPQTDHDHGDLG